MDGIHFVLNGTQVSYEGSATNRLLDILRDTYNCKSVKCGCGEGECGACAVLIDNLLHNSCCVAVGAVDGRDVVTLEGFSKTKQFSVLDKAFAEVSAVQCGFCTPGMVLAAESLLAKNPHPTEDEIREGMAGNLCRCTGYNSIITAIKNAAKEGDGIW